MSKRALTTVASALAAASIALVNAGSASAAVTRYCGIATPAFSACSSILEGTIYENQAHYLGSGTVGVCERTTLAGGGLLSRRCANNAVGSATDLFPYYGYYNMYSWAGNDSRWTHTIWGYGYYQRT